MHFWVIIFMINIIEDLSGKEIRDLLSNQMSGLNICRVTITEQ